MCENSSDAMSLLFKYTVCVTINIATKQSEIISNLQRKYIARAKQDILIKITEIYFATAPGIFDTITNPAGIGRVFLRTVH